LLVPHRHTIGITRREMLQVGYSGLLGLGLSHFAQSAVQPSLANRSRPKSLLIVFLTGAASHLETWDPKPDAPDEIRGEYRSIPTRTPGLLATEYLPKLAARSDKFAIVRSLSHRENNHLVATHHVLTGSKQPGAFFDKIASRDDFPNYAAGRSYFRARRKGLPSASTCPPISRKVRSSGPASTPGSWGPSTTSCR